MTSSGWHSQQDLSGRIIAFLEENYGRWYTLSELQDERYLSRSSEELKENLQMLVRKGMIRVKFDGREFCYRALSEKPSHPL